MIESKSIHFPKYGHSTFESVDPAKRYLTLSAQQSFSGGCPESGPENVNGSRSIDIDPVTGESTTSGDRYVNAGGTADSPTRKSGQTQSSSYDDPPNEKADCEGTIRYFSTLSNENTTTMMQSNGKSELEDYEDTFVNGTPYAYQNTHVNELRYDYRKTQFKFKWQADTDEEAKFPVKYFVLFTPEDDPDTTETDESTEVEIVGEPIQWDGSGDESPVFELDPDILKSGEDGIFRLLKVDVDIVHPATGEFDEAKEDSATGSGIVAIKRDDETPVTELKIHASDSLPAGSKVSLLFTNGDRYKVWKDAAMTDEIISSTTELNATIEHTLYIEGLSKSATESSESIKQVYTVGTTVFEGDEVKFTIVEAEFDFQFKAWLREQWVDVPFHPIDNVLNNRIAGGDDREASTDKTASSRLYQAVTIIPFQHLDSDGIKDGTDQNVPGLTTLYDRGDSLPFPDRDHYDSGNRFKAGATPVQSATVDASRAFIKVEARSDSRKTKVRLHGQAGDPLIHWACDIDWNIFVEIDATDPAGPKYQISGAHDDSPAFEIDLETSDPDNRVQVYNHLHTLPFDPFSLCDPGQDDNNVDDVLIPNTTKGNAP